MKRPVVITGASSGIGAATARLLASPEFHLVLVGRNAHRLNEVADVCRGLGASAEAVVADLTTAEGVAAVVKAATHEPVTQGSGALINCAGSAAYGAFAEMPWDDVGSLLAVNLIAPMRLTHALLPWLMSVPGGQIVNVLSIAATHTFPGAAAYCAAKAGLLAASRSLAAELRTQGLRITSILPGATDTPIWDGGDFVPNRADMLSAEAVAEAIAMIVHLPADRNVDELTLMPPKGIL